MNKNELKEFFNNIKLGDTFSNVRIEGVKFNETSTVMQELARRKNIQFDISFEYDGINSTYTYKVITPSKKFLQKQGCWSLPISNRVEKFLEELGEF